MRAVAVRMASTAAGPCKNKQTCGVEVAELGAQKTGVQVDMCTAQVRVGAAGGRWEREVQAALEEGGLG